MNDSKVRYGRRMDVLACEKEAVDADTKKMEKENQMTDHGIVLGEQTCERELAAQVEFLRALNAEMRGVQEKLVLLSLEALDKSHRQPASERYWKGVADAYQMAAQMFAEATTGRKKL